MTAVERGTDLRGAILERVRAMSVGRDFSALVWTRQRRTTVGMGSLRHRRIKERTILEEGEINDFRDRMGACDLMFNLSHPLAKSPAQRLLRTCFSLEFPFTLSCGATMRPRISGHR